MSSRSRARSLVAVLAAAMLCFGAAAAASPQSGSATVAAPICCWAR